MLPSHTVTQTITRNWIDLYETIWKPEFFSRWAFGLCQGEMIQDGDHWKTGSLDQEIRIRFTPYNAFGIMDHFVTTHSGKERYVPMRVIANQCGADVIITLFQDELTSDKLFSEAIAATEHDLQKLNLVMTG